MRYLVTNYDVDAVFNFTFTRISQGVKIANICLAKIKNKQANQQLN